MDAAGSCGFMDFRAVQVRRCKRCLAGEKKKRDRAVSGAQGNTTKFVNQVHRTTHYLVILTACYCFITVSDFIQLFKSETNQEFDRVLRAPLTARSRFFFHPRGCQRQIFVSGLSLRILSNDELWR